MASRFFTQVRGEGLEKLAKLAVLKSYDKNQTIFMQGDPCPGVFVVGSGLARVYKISASGKEHVLHIVPPGNTFAEVAAIGQFPCPANAQALEETRCVLLPSREFRMALEMDHTLCLQLLGSFAGWVRHLVDMVEDISLRDALGRVARNLLKSADAEGRIELMSLKKHLASHLNLTSETLSRTLRRLEEAGMIGERGGYTVILDKKGLESCMGGEW